MDFFDGSQGTDGWNGMVSSAQYVTGVWTGSPWKMIFGVPILPNGSRTDSGCGTTSGSTTVTDTAILSTDVGKLVTGTGIPSGATITAVTASTSFTLSAAATATGSVSLVIDYGYGYGFASPYDPNSGFNLIAAGSQDSVFTGMAEAILAAGFADAIIRLAWEFNLQWAAWSVLSTDTTDFIAAIQHIVTLFRAVSPSFTFCSWNPNFGDQGIGDPMGFYPGDAYCDWMGLDAYDKAWQDYPGVTSMWSTILSGTYGLDYLVTEAAASGKKIIIPEWGLGPGSPTNSTPGGALTVTGYEVGGGDDNYFVADMQAWCAANNALSGLWDQGAFLTGGSYPNSLGAVAANSPQAGYIMAPTISAQSVPGGDVGTAYSYTVAVSGYPSPAPEFSVSAGTLPAGLSLDASTGAISGTPSAAATTDFTVTASNLAGSSSLQVSLVVTSGFNPTSVAGVTAWYDASQLNETSGAAMTQWDDLSGNGYTLSGAATYYSAGADLINSKPVVVFNGTDDYLYNASLSLAQPTTVFFVFQFLALTGHNPFWYSSQSYVAMYASGSGPYTWEFYSGDYVGSSTDVVANTAYEIDAVFGTTPEGTLDLNGTLIATGYSGTTAMDGIVLGCSCSAAVAPANFGYFSNVAIAEALVYSGALSASDRSSVQNYLISKWGI